MLQDLSVSVRNLELKMDITDIVRFVVSDKSGNKAFVCSRNTIMRYPDTYLAKLIENIDSEHIGIAQDIDMFEQIFNIFLGFPVKIKSDDDQYDKFMKKCKEFNIDTNVIIDCIVRVLKNIKAKTDENIKTMEIMLYNVKLLQKKYFEKFAPMEELKLHTDGTNKMLLAQKCIEMDTIGMQVTDNYHVERLTIDKIIIDAKINLKNNKYLQHSEANQTLLDIISYIEKNLK